MATLDADDLLAIRTIVQEELVNLLGKVIEGPSQYDGLGEPAPVGHVAAEYDVTIAGAIREALAYVAGPADNLDGLQGSPTYRSRVGGRLRIVGILNNGNRSITSRDDR